MDDEQPVADTNLEAEPVLDSEEDAAMHDENDAEAAPAESDHDDEVQEDEEPAQAEEAAAEASQHED